MGGTDQLLNLEDLPEILCIHLKRFRFDNAYGWSGSQRRFNPKLTAGDTRHTNRLDPAQLDGGPQIPRLVPLLASPRFAGSKNSRVVTFPVAEDPRALSNR